MIAENYACAYKEVIENYVKAYELQYGEIKID